jgi:hypothetical protein
LPVAPCCWSFPSFFLFLEPLLLFLWSFIVSGLCCWKMLEIEYAMQGGMQE